MRARPGPQLGVVLGLGAAVTFGASTPFAKRLLEDARPQLLAGLLYLGAFVVLVVMVPRRRRRMEARVRQSDLPRLAALIVCGGIAAPVLLLVGLERVSGTSGSLLLNLEGPFTVLIGVGVFAEHIGRRATIGAAAVFGGAGLLSTGGSIGSTDAIGALCIAAACLLWGLDNNLTQSLTLRDPFVIVAIKAGAAAVVNLTLALAFGAAMPARSVVAAALALGAISYGASIVLDAYALRLLGAAREAVIFATAPFIGAAIAIPVLSETIAARDAAAALTMAAGLTIMLRDRHAHLHVHEPFVHDHIHLHDEHHRHPHEANDPPSEPHSHVHRHQRVAHAHPHVSDAHHRHRH